MKILLVLVLFLFSQVSITEASSVQSTFRIATLGNVDMGSMPWSPNRTLNVWIDGDGIWYSSKLETNWTTFGQSKEFEPAKGCIQWVETGMDFKSERKQLYLELRLPRGNQSNLIIKIMAYETQTGSSDGHVRYTILSSDGDGNDVAIGHWSTHGEWGHPTSDLTQLFAQSRRISENVDTYYCHKP